MRRVLFVDDEENVLQGIRRLLHPMRGEWEMEFAESGPAGLEALASRPFDVVVSDMRMPGMDGAAFLGEVRRLYPRTARIVLSGHSDRQPIMQALGTTHQFLAKPCDADVLRKAIDRICALLDLLEGERVRTVVASMDSLPSMPALFQEITRLAEDPESGLAEIGSVVERDVAMSATILRLVNSAYFGLARNVESVTQGIMLLGLDTIRALVVGSHVFHEYGGAAASVLSLEELWEHSFRTSVLARTIAREEKASAEVTGHACIGGMMHDVGKLVLATHDTETYREILQAARADAVPVSRLETEHYRASHAEIGGFLLGLWGFPDEIVRAVAFHPQPRAAHAEPGSATLFVHVADALARPSPPTPLLPDVQFLEELGVADRLPDWRARCTALAARGTANPDKLSSNECV